MEKVLLEKPLYLLLKEGNMLPVYISHYWLEKSLVLDTW